MPNALLLGLMFRMRVFWLLNVNGRHREVVAPMALVLVEVLLKIVVLLELVGLRISRSVWERRKWPFSGLLWLWLWLPKSHMSKF